MDCDRGPIRRHVFAAMAVLALVHVGCAGQTRTISIIAQPRDATINIDGQPVGTGTVRHQFRFQRQQDTHLIQVSRSGYRDGAVQITQAYVGDTLQIELRPVSRRVSIAVLPVPAIIHINGEPASTQPVTQVTRDLNFQLHEGQWTTHHVVAHRPGFVSAEQTITLQDGREQYILQLEPLSKQINLTTDPPGAAVYLDGDYLGQSPVQTRRAFPMDPNGDQWLQRQLRAEMDGYQPAITNVSWDDGRADYHLVLRPPTKTVHIATQPPDADVSVEGATTRRVEAGVVEAELAFTPDANGQLPSFLVTIQKRTEDRWWEPQQLTIGWDDGRGDYAVVLEEVTAREVQLCEPLWTYDHGEWRLNWQVETISASTDLTDPALSTPQQVAAAPPQAMPLSFTIDASGTLFVALLEGQGHSRIARLDQGALRPLTDGQHLDLYPAAAPDGSILFCSDRDGAASVYSLLPDGGVQRLTRDCIVRWPTIDPSQRLVFEAYRTWREDPRICRLEADGTLTDLTLVGGTQPAASADGVVFAARDPRTGLRDLFIIPSSGGAPANLTHTPDADEFDAAWSPDGRFVAYASTSADPNADVWVLQVSTGRRFRITSNLARDDRPVWGPDGFVYFRSARGGHWGIWRSSLPQD